MRAISTTRSCGVKATTVESVLSCSARFSTRQCADPRAATCGEWVTTKTCPSAPNCAKRRPTASAVAPPTPRSISSKIMVRCNARSDRQTLSANKKRLSSPPEAIFSRAPVGAPGFVATVKATVSVPVGPASLGVISVLKTARSILSGANSAAIA